MASDALGTYWSDAQRWYSGPADVPGTVLVECMHCTSMIETRTGEEGVQDAINQGWSVDGAGDLICAACTEAREELIGDET